MGWTKANNEHPDQMLHNVVSDLGMHYWLIEYLIELHIKINTTTQNP